MPPTKNPPRSSDLSLVALLMCATLFLTAGCSAATSLIPKDVFQGVNDDGREWTYDTAWQSIRMLNAKIEQESFESIPDSALVIASQMERLERGKAGPLSSKKYHDLIDQVTETAVNHNDGDNYRNLIQMGSELQTEFDEGNFEKAKSLALAVFAVSALLVTPTNQTK